MVAHFEEFNEESHYIDLSSSLGKYEPCEALFHEDLPRLPVPHFYYSLEDIVFEVAKKKEGLMWSIRHPTHIFEFSPWRFINFLGTLCLHYHLQT